MDWRPDAIEPAKKLGCTVLYGDAGDSDVWEEVSLSKAEIVISTIGQNQEDDIILLRWLHINNPKILKILESNVVKDARELYNYGADMVLFHDKLEWLQLEKYLRASKTERKRMKHYFEP